MIWALFAGCSTPGHTDLPDLPDTDGSDDLVRIQVVVDCPPEIHGNGVDEDCDGFDAECGTVVRGDCRPDLTLTEIYPNPTPRVDRGAWIEVQNTGDQGVDLLGAVVRTDHGVHTIDRHLALLPGEHALLAASALPQDNGDLDGVDAVLPSLRLGADADTVVLEGVDGTVLDDVAYDARFSSGDAVPYRASLSLDPNQASNVLNDAPTFWCDARSSFGDGSFGTPGEENDDCDYSMDFTYQFYLAGPWGSDVCGSTSGTFYSNLNGRWFDAGSAVAVYTRGTDAAGQYLRILHETGVLYTAERGFGEPCFTGGSISATTPLSNIEVLPESFWTNDSCPKRASRTRQPDRSGHFMGHLFRCSFVAHLLSGARTSGYRGAIAWM